MRSLWGQKTSEARALFLPASNAPDRRVAINGLIGLCKAGGTDARLGLISLLQSDDPLSRRGAAWAMGQLGNPEFAEALEALRDDPDEHLRDMAIRSRAMLRKPKPALVRDENTLVY